MPLDIGALLLTAEARLTQARELADTCRERGELHVPLMSGVFLMEDIVFMLHQMKALNQETSRVA